MADSFVHSLAVCVVLMMPIMATPVTSGVTDGICHGLDCPKYTVLNNTKDWELRRYGVTKWVATTATSMDKDSVNNAMFQLLFKYISGENENKAKINMTAPVLTKIIHGQGPNCESEFVMHFMVPFDLWKAPAKPTNPKVTLVDTPQMDVYVRSFGGFARDQDYIENVDMLAKSLPADAKVEDASFFTAGYDGPYTFKDRHNEVWLQKL